MIISSRIAPPAGPVYRTLFRRAKTSCTSLARLLKNATASLQRVTSLAFRLSVAALAPVAAVQAQTNYANPYTFTTLAGSGTAGSTDGTGTAAQFSSPFGTAVDASGNIYVADTANDTIRKITPAGVVTTLAGTAGVAGSTDATGTAAKFSGPRGVAVDASGNIFVADTANHTIRKITSAGVVSTLAGTAGSHGQADGTGGAALFETPYGIAVDSAGNVYVTDISNNNVRKITPAGAVTTLAGSTAGTAGSQGSTDGAGTAARFNQPYGVAVDSNGNAFVADTSNNTIRKITPSGVVSTYAGALTPGSADGTLLAARFNLPVGVAVDSAGNVFVEDLTNHTLREITVAGAVITLGGSPGQLGVVNATGSVARMYSPYGLAVDSSENLYFAETTYNHMIRKATPASVALGTANQLIGWGSGQHYQLGLANISAGSVPVMVPGLDGYKITAVASSANHVVAVAADGSLLAWGLNAAGQLGDNSTNASSDPVLVDNSGVLAGKTVTAVAVNDLSSYALTSDGKVYAWGNNSHGELGNNSTTSSSVPVAVSTAGVLAGKTIIAIAAGDGCAYALSSDGLVFSWGDNSWDQLGNGSSAAHSLVPVAVTTSGVLTGKTITAIAAGATGSICAYALASDGHVYSWGFSGSAGQLGNNAGVSFADTPVAVYTAGVLAGKTIVAIAAGQNNGYALSSTGEVFSWGSNSAGELGTNVGNIGTGSSAPVQVLTSGALAGKTLTAVGAGGSSAYVLASDNTLYSWGGGSLGRTTGAVHLPGAVDQSGVLSGVQITNLQSGTSSDTFFVLASPSSLAFTTQPVSQTVVAGNSVTFTAAATGSPSPTYQWKKGGVAIAGATSATYTIANVVSADAGDYTVVATNSGGVLVSSTATLTVNVSPVITTQPSSVTVTAGSAASFTVAASGTPTPTYQWKKGSVAISGATGTTYTIASVVAGDAGSYTAVATNSAGSATSTAVTLTVSAATSAPTITTQPVSQTAAPGSAASFTVTASGNPTPTFQWKKGSVTIAGATSATYSIASVVAGDAGSYTVVATNSAGSDTSTSATLTVSSATTAPAITTQPISQSAALGSTVSFTVAASGSPAPTFQWKKGGAAITGATSATYTIAGVGASDAGSYTAVATNSAGSATSSAATLTISAASSAPVITIQPANQTVTSGRSVTFSVAASGNPALAYQWSKDGAAIAGATGNTFTIGSAAAANAGAYSVVVSNAAGSVTSATATLVVISPRLINLSSRAACGTGNNVTIGGVVISGVSPKKVLVRAVGPTLSGQGLSPSELLSDPVLEVHDTSHGTPIASNDNWGDNTNAAEITSVAAQVGAIPLAADDTRSAALLLTLNPGVYTFVASGKNGAAGVVLLELYDADSASSGSAVVNFAARAQTTTGNGVTIGGFVISGNAPKQILLRGVGPTLANQGINQPDVLADPVIELHDASHGNATIATNDSWGDNANAALITSTALRIGALPFASTDTKSAALLLTLQPGIYTFVVSGKNGSSGIVLIEVYDAD